VTANPFVALYEHPVATLTAFAYGLTLLAALVGTWYAAGRNAIYLWDRWRDGWLALPPLWYTVRAVAMLLVVATDALLLAALVYVWT
jgi:hypothetical protein